MHTPAAFECQGCCHSSAQNSKPTVTLINYGRRGAGIYIYRGCLWWLSSTILGCPVVARQLQNLVPNLSRVLSCRCGNFDRSDSCCYTMAFPFTALLGQLGLQLPLGTFWRYLHVAVTNGAHAVKECWVEQCRIPRIVDCKQSSWTPGWSRHNQRNCPPVASE